MAPARQKALLPLLVLSTAVAFAAGNVPPLIKSSALKLLDELPSPDANELDGTRVPATATLSWSPSGVPLASDASIVTTAGLPAVPPIIRAPAVMWLAIKLAFELT